MQFGRLVPRHNFMVQHVSGSNVQLLLLIFVSYRTIQFDEIENEQSTNESSGQKHGL